MSCEHPDRDVSYSETGDYDESKVAHCSACGHEWFISQREWRELTSFDEGGKAARSDAALADFVARLSTMTAKDLRRVANIAAKAAETKHHQETGTIPLPPIDG